MEKQLELTSANIANVSDEVIDNITRQALEDEIYELAVYFEEEQLIDAIRDIVRQIITCKRKLQSIDRVIPTGMGENNTYSFRVTNYRVNAVASLVSCSNDYEGTGVSEAGYPFWNKGYDDLESLVKNLLLAMDEAYCVCIGLI